VVIATYVGKTGRTLTHHLKEHKRALTTVNPMDSALAENAINTGHEIGWSDAGAIIVLYMTVQRLQAVLTNLLLMADELT